MAMNFVKGGEIYFRAFIFPEYLSDSVNAMIDVSGSPKRIGFYDEILRNQDNPSLKMDSEYLEIPENLDIANENGFFNFYYHKDTAIYYRYTDLGFELSRVIYSRQSESSKRDSD